MTPASFMYVSNCAWRIPLIYSTLFKLDAQLVLYHQVHQLAAVQAHALGFDRLYGCCRLNRMPFSFSSCARHCSQVDSSSPGPSGQSHKYVASANWRTRAFWRSVTLTSDPPAGGRQYRLSGGDAQEHPKFLASLFNIKVLQMWDNL